MDVILIILMLNGYNELIFLLDCLYLTSS